ncbi:uncharacterized protein LOC134540423 [Bacillus rossius redtenbacheri]|uniref:uncharacterized protein LOC134540423 n=1 Tax=Bacillus rossius redtenbacheri TaxID=93214 RepID=UPI002FDCEC9D
MAQEASPVVQDPAKWDTTKEERRSTGRYVVLVVVVSACVLGLYQACLQHNAVLAGLIVPALIMVMYVAWVLYTARNSRSHQWLAAAIIRERAPNQKSDSQSGEQVV